MVADKIFEETKKSHLITIGFLKALKNRHGFEEAFKVASDAFANYMIEYYRLVLSATTPGLQERFDKFREHYRDYAGKKNYIKIIRSDPNILEVRFDRCPFVEVMAEYGLSGFSCAFCLSDSAFTKEILPGVKFQRNCEIAKGDKFCNPTWLFRKGGD